MNDLDQERADLNALIREAHEVTKDLRLAIRDANAVLAEVGRADHELGKVVGRFEEGVRLVAETNIREVVDARVSPLIEELLDQVIEQIRLVTDAIYERFDAMTDALTGGEGKIAWNNLPLPDYLQSTKIGRKEKDR